MKQLKAVLVVQWWIEGKDGEELVTAVEFGFRAHDLRIEWEKLQVQYSERDWELALVFNEDGVQELFVGEER